MKFFSSQSVFNHCICSMQFLFSLRLSIKGSFCKVVILIYSQSLLQWEVLAFWKHVNSRRQMKSNQDLKLRALILNCPVNITSNLNKFCEWWLLGSEALCGSPLGVIACLLHTVASVMFAHLHSASIHHMWGSLGALRLYFDFFCLLYIYKML